MENNTPLVQVSHLKQYFPVNMGLFRTRQLKAVDDVSFSVFPGETLGLVGESGCGKSTLGRSVLQLYKPTAGQVLFERKPLDSRQALEHFRRRSAMVFQDPYSSLDPRMTVADIIGEPMDIQGLYASRAQRRERILERMARVGLNPEHAERYAHEFSGGQRQRIGIARALATDPSFVVCDEPVSALDVSIQAQVINMLRDLQQQLGLTYLFIAHDLLVVRYISHRIAVMYLGKLVELGPAEGVYDRPMHPYTQSLIAAVPLPDPELAGKKPVLALRGELPSPLNVPSGCPFRTRCPRASDICREQMPELTELETNHFAACHHPGPERRSK